MGFSIFACLCVSANLQCLHNTAVMMEALPSTWECFQYPSAWVPVSGEVGEGGHTLLLIYVRQSGAASGHVSPRSPGSCRPADEEGKKWLRTLPREPRGGSTVPIWRVQWIVARLGTHYPEQVGQRIPVKKVNPAPHQR